MISGNNTQLQILLLFGSGFGEKSIFLRTFFYYCFFIRVTRTAQAKKSSSKPGVPNLSLTMYPFSISTNNNVPLQHVDR